MADPAFFGLPLEFTTYRVRTVFCPCQGIPATVTAAMWTLTGKNWAPWTVVDCSLLPAGTVTCEMGCLEQMEHEGVSSRL